MNKGSDYICLMINFSLKMKKLLPLAGLALICMFHGCKHPGSFSSADTQMRFEMAEVNGKLANEGFNRCMNYLNAWLSFADTSTGLIPSNINNKTGRDIWNAQDCAAGNYPSMVLTSYLLDRQMFNGRMTGMLRTETRLTSRLGSLPDTYSFSKKGFATRSLILSNILFGSAEYVKEGLIPLTEWLGPSPWSERMISIVDDAWKYAPVKTQFGNIVSDDPEVNGDMLLSLLRIYRLTGDSKYLNYAIRIGDYYLLGKNHPTRDFKQLKLREYGCELISGLCELYANISFTDSLKKEVYKTPIYEMLDRILATGRNSDGLFYNSINPVIGIPLNGGITDNFGYLLNGYYTVYLIDKIVKYREPVLKALSALNAKYRNFPWQGTKSDGYADAIEGVLNLCAREPVPSAEQWINSEIKVMWNKQQESGIIEGWKGDSKFARTTIMYSLWKTGGTHLEPWRSDLEIGAFQDDSLLYLTIYGREDWKGNLMFDRKRHSEFLHLPLDWPRIGQFPEYFSVETGRSYNIQIADNDAKNETLNGEQLLRGFPVTVRKGNTLKLIIRALKQ
jgi:hypothetical protein